MAVNSVRPHRLSVAASCLVLLAGCAAPIPSATPSRARPPATTTAPATTAAPAPSQSATPTATAPIEACQDDAAALSLEAQIGQLIMVGVDGGLDAAERRAITASQVGSVVLLGAQDGGVKATAERVAEIAALNPDAAMLAAADQEGGLVQRLQGTGFARIPSAAKQAKLPLEELETAARSWGRALGKADIGLNLAPVGDVVPASKATRNAPIGKLGRGYGSDPEAVTARTQVVITGLADEGVAATVKHFPGLGEVTGNTDNAAGVVDRVTRTDSAALAPFKAAVEGDVGAVMVASATYAKIDASHQAVFSATVIGLLRQWGYDGVVISDDLGAAVSLRSVPASQRAVRFLAAGGDLVINASPGLTAAMVAGVKKRAGSDPAFAQRLTVSAARVLALKEKVGRYDCG
ncbi:MAG TPA: glycoside hydrolase family 3 N-terminal domain-containing protein [Propionicimonas sp.]|uniref:glycoside hydrolase family 3 N-terminal domain-containing protein n=1 Tax=Propionicimonas sp. TaxID=1955623 RepID=UPI002F405BD5